MSECPYLVTKVTVPPVRATIIARPSLTSRLDTRVPLILLAAGAGFGKTTLLSAWVRETQNRVAWLTLDEQDNDPTRFWDYVLLALQTSVPALGEATATLFHAVPPPPFQTSLTVLLNELARLEEEVALILDDYHLIDAPVIHQSLAFWLAHAPACLNLVLATRVEPDLPLPRLRARGHLVELREADFRLDVHEAAYFLSHTMDLQLHEADVLQLFQRTEGWIAGLQLAALSLRTQADPSAWIAQFRGSHRILLDYIQQDILEREPLSTQHFLLRTSVLTHLTAALCQALTGDEASQRMLESLERSNLFVVPLDEERHWYRSHPLFREALLARLQTVEPEQVPLLHQCASAWFAQQRLLPEAIAHALAAHDVARAAELIESVVVPQSWRNEYHTLRRWLSHLPPTVVRARPALSFLLAQALILTDPSEPSTWRRAQEPLIAAEQGYREARDQRGRGSVLVIRAVLTIFRGEFAAAFDQAREALCLLPSEDRQFRGLGLLIRGIEAVFSGQHARSVPFLQQALALCDASGSLPGMQAALLMLGDVSLAAGDLQQAASFFHQVLSVSRREPDLTRDQLTNETGGRRAHFEGLAWYSLAYLAYLRNDLAEAQHALEEGVGESWFPLLHVLTPGLLLQVRLLQAQGSAERAQILLGKLAARRSRPEVQREIWMSQAWLAFAQGDLTEAARWAEKLIQANAPLAFARQEEEALLLARLLRISGRPEAALRVLEPGLLEAREQGREQSELQILIQQALAEAATGARTLARQILLQAVTAGSASGSQRLFLEEGQPMETLLKRILPDVREQAQTSFVQTLLRAFASARHPQDASDVSRPSMAVTRLSPQERRVVAFLAAGATNQEIASALVIGLSTAKKHVAHVLSKLGAQNRTQAVARAREDGLL